MVRYKINYGDMSSLKQRIKMCYAFLTMDWGFQPEVSIVTEKSEFDQETMYIKNAAPTFREFFKEYCQYRKGIHGVVGFDKTDDKRLGILLIAEEFNTRALVENKPLIFINDYSDSDKETLLPFFEALYAAFDAVEE